jgi:hypothetical protein
MPRGGDRAPLREPAEAGRRALEALHGPSPLPVVVVAIRDQVVVARSNGLPSWEDALGRAATPEDRRIASALTGDPQTARSVARRSGCTYNSYFRRQLAALVEAGVARRTRLGYSRA